MPFYRSLTASRMLTPTQAVEMSACRGGCCRGAAAGGPRGVLVLLHGYMASRPLAHGGSVVNTCWRRGQATCRCSCSACSAVSQIDGTAAGPVHRSTGCTPLRGCQRHSQLLQGLAVDKDAGSSLKTQAHLLEVMPQLPARN